MPTNAKQVEQDVRALTNALKAFSDATGGAAAQYSVFSDVLKRLEGAGFLRTLNIVSGDLEAMTRLVRNLGNTFGVSRGKIDGMVASLEKLTDARRLSFKQGQTPLVNVTRGPGGQTAFGDAVTDESFQKNVLGGARAIESINNALNRMNVGRAKDLQFEMQDIKNVTEDSARGVTRWTVEVNKMGQVVRRATIVTNRYGKEIRTTSRQLRSFGAGIARDIVEVTKWTIAIAVVYAPLKRLTDLMQEAVQIEAKLADVQVALVNSTKSLETVWQEASKVARELGVSVEGVVDGYVLATRATANILNPTDRASATVAVLRDSMLLAKLAGIDQAIALDTLVGALRQLQQPLTEGQDLLDKWVAVSKAANVSIGTLAESFAITATAAGNVGISIDKLNGIIAAVAEVTTLSATESGNAVRAFISGFQKDRSERELTRFGISIRQVNGELRSFTEIIEDIVSRREVGLISDRELAKLSEIIGGGARRGPQVNAILENYGRVNELAAISAEANGDATAALAIKMDTVQTATTNLNNAFTELARALGSDAGFLDGAQDTIKVLTGVVDALTGVVQILGKATPAIIAFTVAFLALRHSARLQDLLGQNLAQIVGRVPGAGGFLENQAIQRGGTAGLQGVGSRLAGFFGRGGGGVGGAAIGLGAAALSGQSLVGSPRDARRTGATIGAGAVGTILAGGNPIGGLIGASIVQAVYSNFIDIETDLVGVFTRIFTDSFGGVSEAGAAEAEADRIADRQKELFELLGQVDRFGLFQIEDIGRLKAGLFAALGEHDISPDEDTISNYAIAIAELASGKFGAQTVTESFFSFLFGEGLSEEDKARIAEILEEMQEEGRAAAAQEAPAREGTAFARAIVGTQEGFAGIGGDVFQTRRRELVQEVGRGQAGVRELRELEALGQLFDNQLDTIYTGLIAGARNTALSYEESANIIINASEEERKGILDLAGDIGVLFNALEDLRAGGAPQVAIGRAVGEISAEQRRLDETITLTGQSQRFKAFQPADLIDIAGDITPELIQQLQELVEAARVESNELLETMTVDEAEQAKVIDSWGELGFLSVEAWEVAMKGIEGVSPRILEQMVEDAGLAADEIGKLSIQTPDITGAEFQQAVQQRLPGINELIKSVRREAGFAEEDLLDIEQLGFIFKDNVTDVIHADQLAIQLLLRDIKELNEDQLEGIFNIPEGMTALIPFTGQLFFSDQPIAAGGGSEGLALGTDIEGQTDILHGDLVGILDGLRREEAVLTPEQIEERREELSLEEELAHSIAQVQGVAPAIDLSKIDPDTGLPLDQRPSNRYLAGRGVNRAQEEQIPSFLDLLTDFFNTGFLSELLQPYSPPQAGEVGAGPAGAVGALGGFGAGIQEVLEATLPQSIPVTINTRITNPVTVMVDGRKIQQVVEERSFQDLGSATRRAGALGFVQE